MTAILLLALQTGVAATFNIEIDYMDSTASGGHSHKPQPDEIAAVVQMFACHGITLNAVVDQAIPHSNVLFVDPTNANNFFGYSGVTNSFGYLRTQYFNHAGQAGWHYCIFIHDYAGGTNEIASGSSGLGQQPGGNFVVSLGSFTGQIGTPFDRAATLAHEFGHNLGLAHGAGNAFQPNKPSIMSYFYQLAGVRSASIAAGLTTAQASLFKELDYSDGTMCTLNENGLNEQFGSGMVSVDWDCNGTISGTVSANIDAASTWCGSTNTGRTVLPDVVEWSLIHDTTLLGLDDKVDEPKLVSCITVEEMKHYQDLSPVKQQPAVVTEPCVTAKMIYLTTGGAPAGTGLCSNPFTTVGLAQTAATDGSHLFLLPGTYTLDAGPVVLNRPMTIFCNIGVATVRPH